MRAIADAYKEMKVRSRLPKLSEDEIKQLLSFCHRDRRTYYYSYHDLLQHTLGEEQALKYEQMDMRELELEAEDADARGGKTFVMPTGIVPTGIAELDAIGNEMIRSGHNYEDALKHAMGANPPDNRVTKEQVWEALQQGGVALHQQLGTYLLYVWFQAKQDHEGKVPVTDFLIAVGLPP